MTLLAHRRKIAANVTKSRRAALCAKGPRNLLLHFDHAQVALGLVVSKRDGEVIQKGQHLVRASEQVDKPSSLLLIV
jgi:hypothetical protein